MMIAETVTNFSAPEQVAAWLACAAFTMWFFLLVDKTIHRMRGRPAEPPNLMLGQSLLEVRRRVEVLENQQSMLISKLEHDKIQILEAGEERAVNMHERINEVLSAVSELRGIVSTMRRH